MSSLLKLSAGAGRRLRRRRYLLPCLAAVVVLAALFGVVVVGGAVYAGAETWDRDLEYGNGQVGPGGGGDWRPLQTCWRVANPAIRYLDDPYMGTDLDWAYCHELEYPAADPNAGKPNCFVDPSLGVSDDRLFSIFLGDYQQILSENGANLISMNDPRPDHNGAVNTDGVVYKRAYGDPDAAASVNLFVPRDRLKRGLPGKDVLVPPDADVAVYQSREHYLRDLYNSGDVPGSGTGGAWFVDKTKFEQVPAREAARFFIRWQHPDHPMGGLMTDYAYVLQQQNYLNAQLLGNVRSYNADGSRVIYKVQSKEAVLLHGQQVGNCGTPGGTVHPHPATCTLTGTITSHRVVYPNTIALSYDYNPAPPRFGPTPTPFITVVPPAENPPVPVPERGDYETALTGRDSPTGTKLPAPYLTPVFQQRQAFDAGLPRPVGAGAPTAPPGFVGEQVHVPEYTYYDVSRVGTYDYPYYGILGVPWEDWGVDYHRVLMDSGATAMSRWASENLVSPDGLPLSVANQWPNSVGPTVAWYLTTKMPTPQYGHAAGIGIPDGPVKNPFADASGDRLHGQNENDGKRYFESHNARNPYPTPDQLIFSDGPARQVENPFIIRDYPNTSLDGLSIEMEFSPLYREDLAVNYSQTSELLDIPIPVSRYGGESAAPLFSLDYTSATSVGDQRTGNIAGYEQFYIQVDNYAPSCIAGVAGCPYRSYSSGAGVEVRPGTYDARGEDRAAFSPANQPGPSIGETYRYRWPVFFDDASWYLFELHGVNKALADSKAFAAGVLDSNPFVDTTGYPAWALDPRMSGRPYDAIGHPFVNTGPLPLGSSVPEIPHRYYGGGLLNYRNTVDPREHKESVEAMAAVMQVQVFGDKWGEQANHGIPGLYNPGTPDGRPAPVAGQVEDDDGYGMFTNRKVFWKEKYAGFDGRNAVYKDDDVANALVGKSRNHNLSFLPLVPVQAGDVGIEPGGTLVKRGVTSPAGDGSNSSFDWAVYDSSPVQVYGGHDLSTYQVLGMPTPGSFLFGLTQHQWPDYPLDPNLTYLMAVMYYEVGFLPPFYIANDPSGVVSPEAYGRSIEVLGKVPRVVMRPVFCRVLIQPLGVNEGPGLWRKATSGLKSVWNTVDNVTTGGALTRTFLGVKGKIEGTVDKVKDFVKNLNPITWFTNLLSSGAKGLADKGATSICSGGQMADYAAGTSGGEASETDDLDAPHSSGNRRAKSEAVDRCRNLSAAQDTEAQSCPEGTADDGFCGLIPEMEIQVAYNQIEPVHVPARADLDNDAAFGRMRGFYVRRHFVDADPLPTINLSASTISPGPLQFGYYTPGVNVPLPQRGYGGVDYSTNGLRAPHANLASTRCPTEWEIHRMQNHDTDPWRQAVQRQDFSSSDLANNVPSRHPEWDAFPVGDPGPKLDGDDVQRAYNDGFCAPVFVAVGCDAGPDGQCTGVSGPRPWAAESPWAAFAGRDPLIALPIEWRTTNPTSADARPNYLDISITSNSPHFGPVYFDSNTTGLPVQGNAHWNSSAYLMFDSSTHEQIYRVPGAWREKKDTGTEDSYVRAFYTGFVFGSLQGSSVAARYDISDDYKGLCERDMPSLTGSVCDDLHGNRAAYFSALSVLPTEDGDFGLNPGGIHDPIRDYDALVNDLSTHYAMSPGASYTLRVRGVLVEATGKDTYGAWSNELVLDAASLCPTIDADASSPVARQRYEDIRAGLGCNASNEVLGAETLAFASVGSDVPPGVSWVWRMVGTNVCSGFFDSTPARLTWAVDGVVRGWGMVWVVSMAALVFLIFWQGIRMTYDM